MSELAERLGQLREEGHPEKFMFHYGRMKASSSKLIKSVFLDNYGTATVGNHTSICEGGKWTAQELTWGAHYDNWDFDKTRFVLNFGSNVFEAHTNHTSEAQRLIRERDAARRAAWLAAASRSVRYRGSGKTIIPFITSSAPF